MKRHPVSASSYFVLYLFLFHLLTACTSIRPSGNITNLIITPEPESFEYKSLSHLLAEFVDDEGLVDYKRLKAFPEHLKEFYGQLAAYSPDSHPSLFPTENDKLAYWINAYNSTVILGVVHYYPIDGVADVSEPPLLFFFPSKSGFFFFQRFTYGGVETNLYSLENSVIRKRFNDPRYHFALNCASRSCPKLPRVPFLPETLDQQLDTETYKFINDENQVRFDIENNTLYLSSIFNWYEEDFISWLRLQGINDPSLPSYIAIFSNPDFKKHLQQHPHPEIKFLHYDWSLNDQN